MTGNIASMFKPNSEQLDLANDVIGRSVQLLQSQMDVTENTYTAVSKEFRELLVPAEPAAMFQHWTKALDSATRSVSQGGVEVLKNAINFQAGYVQLMQDKMPQLSKQMMDGLIAATRVAASSEEAPEAFSSRSHAGRADSLRTRKAA